MPPPAKRPWTPREVALLRQLRAQGVSRNDIAQRLGRSFTAVKHMIDRAGAQTFRCPTCRQDVASRDMAWNSARPGIPPCRPCAADARGERTRCQPYKPSITATDPAAPTKTTRGAFAKGQDIDPARAATVEQYRADVWAGEYEYPLAREWVARLSDTDVMGKLIRDMLMAAKREAEPRKTMGRIPADWLKPADLERYLPAVLRPLLDLPDRETA